MRVDLTFRADESCVRQVFTRLDRMGFVIASSGQRSRILLDTFDGRLDAAGLRLEITGPEGRCASLTGRRTSPAYATIDERPRFATDLPPGPFRDRVETSIDARALLPVLQISSAQTDLVRYNSDGKLVARVIVYERPIVGDQIIDSTEAVIEIQPVIGYDVHLDDLSKAFRQTGAQRCKRDLVTLAAAAGRIDLKGFDNSPRVSLDAAMPALVGFRAVLRRLTATIDGNWQGTLDRVDAEFLHDLRIAVRRTRAVLDQGTTVLPSDVLDLARSGFSRLGALTGPPRDLDVYLIEWHRYTAGMEPDEYEALEPARQLIEQRRDEAYIALSEGMRSATTRTMIAEWREWLAEPDDERASGDVAPPNVGGRTDPTHPLGRLIVKRIRRAQRKVLERGRLIDPDSPSEHLHDLRKDAKSCATPSSVSPRCLQATPANDL